jgi:hypothetical protein
VGAVLRSLSICIALLNEQPILPFFARGFGKPQQREAAFQARAVEFEFEEALAQALVRVAARAPMADVPQAVAASCA